MLLQQQQQQVRMEMGSSSSAASYGSSGGLDSKGKGGSSPLLPPLMDVNIIEEKINRASETTAAGVHVTCFSNAAVLNDRKGNKEEKEEEEEYYSTNPNQSLEAPDYYLNTNTTATVATISTGTTTYGPFATCDISPSSFFISKTNMNMPAAPSNSLGLNMHHHHHHHQQQQIYMTTPRSSLMQLLLQQSNVFGAGDGSESAEEWQQSNR